MHFQISLKILLIPLLIAFFPITSAATDTTKTIQKANEYLNQGQFYLALQGVEHVLKDASNTTLQSASYGIKGSILLTIQQYEKAKKALLQAYELAEEGSRKASYAKQS